MKASRLFFTIGVVVSLWLATLHNAWAFDASQYLKAKAAGAAMLVKDADGRVLCTYTRFDPTTGKVQGTYQEEIMLTDLKAQVTANTQRNADIAALVAEVKALP